MSMCACACAPLCLSLCLFTLTLARALSPHALGRWHGGTEVQLDKAHFIVDEMLANGFVVETNKNIVLEPLNALDK